MNKRGIPSLDIDLTSLLDVIFIVLMVVMCHQALGTQAAEQEIEELTTQLDSAVAENEVHETQLNAYENADDLVAYVTLRADYDTQNPRTRHIQLAYNNDVAFEEITITPETEKTGYATLEDNMNQFLTGKAEMPVLIVLNEDHILYRDQVKISQLLDELGEQYTNLYQTGK